MKMKRLIFCFDGTWNNLDSGNVTNVGITAQSIAPSSPDGASQFVYYDEGVGNARRDANVIVTKMERLGGGLFGHGLLANLSEAYKFLIFNYQPGDQIFVFGFSRGAFSARSFTGLLQACGVLRRSHAERISEAITNYTILNPARPDDAIKLNLFRWQYAKDTCVNADEDAWRCDAYPAEYKPGASPILNIDYLGVWDTVGSLGIPNHWKPLQFLNNKYRFHDCRLSAFVKKARHAVAIDERRKSFAATIWDNLDEVNRAAGSASDNPKAPYQEVWFPGTHGSVGGGGGIRGLSDEALNWVLTGAREAGLALDTEDASEIYDVKPNYRAALDNVASDKKPSFFGKAMAMLPKADRLPGPLGIHQVSASARYRWAADPQDLHEKSLYRPITLDNVAPAIDAWVEKEFKKREEKTADGAIETTATESDIKRRFHIVVQGDTLSKIAHAEYGEIAYYIPLFRMNRPLLSNPDEIFIGQEIWLPSKALLDEHFLQKSLT